MSKTRDLDCHVCSTHAFERNNYFSGKLMYPRDFRAEQEYLNQKRWLINRSLFGWGVVCGLEVTFRERDGALIVGEGLGLDCCGREIGVCDSFCVPLAEVEAEIPEQERKAGSRHRLVLCLEYRECRTEPVVDPAVPDCDGPETTRYNRIRDSYAVRVRRLEDLCLDREQPCYLDDLESPDEDREGREREDCRTPGLHEYLCERSKECPRCEPCECLALAVVHLFYPERPDHQGEREEEQKHEREQGKEQRKHEGKRQGGKHEEDECEEPERPRVRIDDCTYRRLVHPNHRLYELIACFHPDAPHIVELGWRDAAPSGGDVGWDRFAELVTTGGIRVVFDQPMEPDTLHHRSFLVTVLIRETGTGYQVRKSIPCREIHYEQKGRCWVATFHPDEEWVIDELERQSSELKDGMDVEIILRGSLITGTSGRALDGDFIGGRLPTGNGVQGGDFVDWFTVRPRSEAARAEKRGGEEDEHGELIEDF